MTASSTANKACAMAWQTRGAAGWLALAASPTFALMAWIATDKASPMALCSMGSSIDGMTTMYLLMSLFHLAPWLKLATGRLSARR
jgi:hypothetical protein